MIVFLISGMWMMPSAHYQGEIGRVKKSEASWRFQDAGGDSDLTASTKRGDGRKSPSH
jgi:hypothetical protein